MIFITVFILSSCIDSNIDSTVVFVGGGDTEPETDYP